MCRKARENAARGDLSEKMVLDEYPEVAGSTAGERRCIYAGKGRCCRNTVCVCKKPGKCVKARALLSFSLPCFHCRLSPFVLRMHKIYRNTKPGMFLHVQMSPPPPMSKTCPSCPPTKQTCLERRGGGKKMPCPHQNNIRNIVSCYQHARSPQQCMLFCHFSLPHTMC